MVGNGNNGNTLVVVSQKLIIAKYTKMESTHKKFFIKQRKEHIGSKQRKMLTFLSAVQGSRKFYC